MRQYTGKVAKEYDKERFGNLKGKVYDFFEKWSITRALKYFHKDTLILDIPCGTGRITNHIYNLGYPVIGADISDDMLKIAKQNVVVPLRIEDIEDMNIKDNTFVCAVCIRLMGHLPNKAKALLEMRRVAKHLIVTFYFKDKPDWYAILPMSLSHLLRYCGLRIVSKHYIFPFWSDGITYLLERDETG